MFGRRRNLDTQHSQEVDLKVVKVLFDAFSKRLLAVEERLRSLGSELDRLRSSIDRSQISDIVLLERLQRAEETLTESLVWIKRVADTVHTQSRTQAGDSHLVTEPEVAEELLGRRSTAPLTSVVALQPFSVIPEPGTLHSITTPTEFEVLTLLANTGPRSAPEIGRAVGRSREHSARLMKKLFDEGYVKRDQSRVPYRYSLVERLKGRFTKTGERETTETREEVAPA